MSYTWLERFSKDALKDRFKELFLREIQLVEKNEEINSKERLIDRRIENIEHLKNNEKNEAVYSLERNIKRLSDELEEAIRRNKEIASHQEEINEKNVVLAKLKIEEENIQHLINAKENIYTYIANNSQAYLNQKDGIINGQILAIETYKDMIRYMQDVLAVAVGKIPEVDFKDFKINITPGQAQQNKPQQHDQQRKPDIKS